MKLTFDKIHACGNDFVLVRNPLEEAQILAICDRRFGVGGDGVMVFEGVQDDVVTLDHYDNDGARSLCLNGARASLFCLAQQGLIPQRGSLHTIELKSDYQISGAEVSLSLPRTSYQPRAWGAFQGFFADVGNPHFVLVDDPELTAFRDLAPRIRQDQTQFPKGANIHLLQSSSPWRIFSYERGVEGFTLACGSGMYAAAEVLAGERGLGEIVFEPEGGDFVQITVRNNRLMMNGPVHHIAQGEWLCG